MPREEYGRYTVEALLGRGGMATVYRAYDPLIRRYVALKVLPRELVDDDRSRVRFAREARTIAALEHAYIVPVYDFGEDRGEHYLVMRLMLGGSLRERILKRPLPPAEILRIVERVADALQTAHAHEIIHRDLKPGNILFDNDGHSYLADFGIVKLSRADATELTAAGGMMGTPAYMSPEQVLARKGVDLDARSDIYSLGVVLFEMLGGRLPYEAKTPMGVAMMHVLEPIPRLPAGRHIPAACQAVIDRAMAKSPAERYPDASSLARALRDAFERTPRSQAGASPSEVTLIEMTEATPIAGADPQDWLYEQAVAAMNRRDWDTAIARLNSILAIDPNHLDTIPRLALANRHKRSETLLVDAEKAFKAGDWESAAELASQVTAGDLQRAQADEIRTRALARLYLADQYGKAEVALLAGEWEAAIELLEAVQRADAGYRDVGRLLLGARASRERRVLVDRLWTEAESAVQDEGWLLASERLNEILALDNQHAEARRLLVHVHEQAAIVAQVQALLDEAEQAVGAAEWRRAVVALEGALRLQPDNAAVQLRVREAQAQEQRFVQMQTLAAQAVAAMSEQRWADAELGWQELLAIAPANAYAAEGLKFAKAKSREATLQAQLGECVRRAKALEQTERWSEAAAAWNEALTLAPEDEALRRRAEAAAQAASVITIRRQALAAEADDNWPAAATGWAALLKIAPDDDDAQARLAAVQTQQESVQQRKAAEEALRISTAAAAVATQLEMADPPIGESSAPLDEAQSRQDPQDRSQAAGASAATVVHAAPVTVLPQATVVLGASPAPAGAGAGTMPTAGIQERAGVGAQSRQWRRPLILVPVALLLFVLAAIAIAGLTGIFGGADQTPTATAVASATPLPDMTEPAGGGAPGVDRTPDMTVTAPPSRTARPSPTATEPATATRRPSATPRPSRTPSLTATASATLRPTATVATPTRQPATATAISASATSPPPTQPPPTQPPPTQPPPTVPPPTVPPPTAPPLPTEPPQPTAPPLPTAPPPPAHPLTLTSPWSR